MNRAPRPLPRQKDGATNSTQGYHFCEACRALEVFTKGWYRRHCVNPECVRCPYYALKDDIEELK